MHHEMPSLTFMPESNGASVAFFSLTDAESLYVEGTGYTYGPRDLLIEKDRHGGMVVTETGYGAGPDKWTDYTCMVAIDAHNAFRVAEIDERIDALASVSADVEDLIGSLFGIEEADASTEAIARYAREARWALGSVENAIEEERWNLAEARDAIGA